MDTKETLRENRFLIAIDKNHKVTAAAILAAMVTGDIAEWEQRGDTVLFVKADTIMLGQNWPALMPQPEATKPVSICCGAPLTYQRDGVPRKYICSKCGNPNKSEPQPEQPERLYQCPKWQECKNGKCCDGHGAPHIHTIECDGSIEDSCGPPCQPAPPERAEKDFQEVAYPEFSMGRGHFEPVPQEQGIKIIPLQEHFKFNHSCEYCGCSLDIMPTINATRREATKRAEVEANRQHKLLLNKALVEQEYSIRTEKQIIIKGLETALVAERAKVAGEIFKELETKEMWIYSEHTGSRLEKLGNNIEFKDILQALKAKYSCK
jgi:hypothetical protein